jgi:uncharacterized protein
MKTSHYTGAILGLAFLYLTTGRPLSAGEEAAPNTISVRASSSVSIKPDTIYVSLYVLGDGMLTEDAVKAANQKSDEIKAALTKAFPKIKELSIVPVKMGEKTSRIYRADETGQAPHPEVINRLLLATEASAGNDVPKIIDTALRAGAVLQVASNTSYAGDLGSAVRYAVADYKRAEDQARSKALDDAREKASALAKVGGRSLGDVVSMSDESPSPTYDYNYYAGANRPKWPTRYLSFSNEPIEITSFFRVAFELKK